MSILTQAKEDPAIRANFLLEAVLAREKDKVMEAAKVLLNILMLLMIFVLMQVQEEILAIVTLVFLVQVLMQAVARAMAYLREPNMIVLSNTSAMRVKLQRQFTILPLLMLILSLPMHAVLKNGSPCVMNK